MLLLIIKGKRLDVGVRVVLELILQPRMLKDFAALEPILRLFFAHFLD
jgi:hypothetical protein